MHDTILGMLAQATHRRYQHDGAQARLAVEARQSHTGIATGPRHRLGQTLVLVGARRQRIND